MIESVTSQTVYVGSGWTLIKLERSPFYYVVAHEKGKQRLFKSTGSNQIGEAKKIAAEIFRKYLLEAKREAVQQNRIDHPKILEDAWAKYILIEKTKLTSKGLSEATFKRKKNAWERMSYFWADKKLSELTQNNFELFSQEHELKFPNCSLQNEHKYLSALAHFLHDSGLIAKKPKIKLGKDKLKSRSDRRKLSKAELKSLISKVQNKNLRQKTLIFLGVYCGMRISEIAKLKTQNIIQKSGKLFLKLEDTKTDKDRTIQVPANCKSIVLEALKGSGQVWLFPNLRNPAKHIPTQTLDKDWHQIFNEASLSDCVFHELRHTAISAAVQKYELAKVSLYFGVSLKTLMSVYVHLDEFEIGEVSGAIKL